MLDIAQTEKMITEIIENVIMALMDEYVFSSFVISLALSIAYPILKWVIAKLWQRAIPSIHFPSFSLSNTSVGLIFSGSFIAIFLGLYGINVFFIHDPTGKWPLMWLAALVEGAIICFLAPTYDVWKNTIVKPMLMIFSSSMIVSYFVGYLIAGSFYLPRERDLDNIALGMSFAYGILGLFFANSEKIIAGMKK